jgi:hypothetical protein
MTSYNDNDNDNTLWVTSTFVKSYNVADSEVFNLVKRVENTKISRSL